ncbi:hypothetical protein CR513_01794, partial [Mucuna pruriens]
MNPAILDVVKKEVTKLLTARIIYPISDSQWVNLVQVILKKSGMTIMKNQHDELNNWRVCIDYKKLNQATRKDHFPLPFNQVLEKLARSPITISWMDSPNTYKFILDLKINTRLLSLAHSTPLRTYMPFGLCNAPSTF